jgi:tetratricopeptide (TPR) repeat protein
LARSARPLANSAPRGIGARPESPDRRCARTTITRTTIARATITRATITRATVTRTAITRAAITRAAAALLLTLTLATAGCKRAPTFSGDIAPIIYRRCAPCHRPGEAGPFALLTYDDVARRAAQIARVTHNRFMPPWKPLPGFAHYAGERRLSDAEIALFSRWAEAGAPVGDRARIPPPPTWPVGWQLGKPDLIVTLTQPWTLPASGPDVYRNLVISAPLVPSARFVSAWELRPGNRAVHHAILNLDRSGWARSHDGVDGKPGFPGMDPGDIQAPDGFYLVWAPGQAPTPPQPGMSWALDEHTDLVLQLHMQPTGKVETVQPTIGLYFGAPPTQPRFTLRVGDMPIDINPGDAHYVARDEYVLAADVAVLSLFPHAHYLARRLRSWAELPDGKRAWLLAIDDWDPRWQQDYVLAEPLLLPRGSKIEMEFTYDNSPANIRNPNHPPARVRTGERSVDEMGNITFSVAVRSAADKVLLREAKYRRQLAQNETARAHYNLGNALSEQGRRDEAVSEYRRALALDETLVPARMNLGVALLAMGDARAAATELLRVAQAWPESAPAHMNLGMARQALHDDAGALTEYRRAVALDQRFVPAYLQLGRALAAAGDVVGARRALEAALRLDPGATAARTLLATLPAR